MFILLLFTFFLFNNLSSFNKLSICSNSEIKYELINENFKNDFLLEDLSYESDVFFEESEFFYLSGLKKGQNVSSQDIKKACFYIIQKNRFNEVSIIVDDTECGKKLHFILKGFYIFNKLKIKGVIFGKDKYIQEYLLDYGKKFDIDKHEASIKSMKEDFAKEGYFNVNISSKFFYDEINKSVTVNINIIKGKRFGIKNVNFDLTNSFLNKAEYSSLLNEIEHKFLNKFIKKYYSWNLIKKEKDNLESYLIKKGFYFVEIETRKNVDIAQNSIDLNLQISLNKKISWKFIGNKYFCESQLLNFLIQQGDYVADMPASILAQELSQIYSQKSFLQTSINATEKNCTYVFNINEGPRSVIDKFIINGSKFITDKYIANKFFKTFLNAKFIKNETLINSIENLTAFYLKSGFWDIKIEKNIVHCKDGKYLIEINIDEGKRRFLKSIEFDKFPQIQFDSFFSKLTNLKKPIPFDINILKEHHKYLLSWLKKKGYQDINIKPDFIADEDLEISLIWKINFDENLLKFGKTIIQGNNSKFPFNRIVRELKYSEGEEWKKENLETTYFRLNDLKVFDSVQLYPANYNDFNNNKPVILKLFPDDPFEIRTRIGFEQVNENLRFKGLATYKVGGSFIYKNPFKFCDIFKIDSEVSRFKTIFVLQYQIPWIFNLPVKTLFQLYYNKYDQPLFIGSPFTIYKVSTVGFLIGLYKKFNKINYGFNVGLEGVKITDLSLERAKAIDFAPSLVDRRVPYFYFEPNLMIDYLDDKIYPTKGFLSVFSFKGIFSLQNSQDYFLKFLIEQSCFSNIFDPIILALRFSFGYVFVDNFSRLMPPMRFFLGGSNTIRSYEPDFAPPLGCYIKENGEAQLVPQGGKTMFNANFELRIPVYKNLTLALFQDIGILIGKESKICFNNLLSATGFGFRYATPIGPVRFDIGWRPKRNNEDSAFMWYITLGQAF